MCSVVSTNGLHGDGTAVTITTPASLPGRPPAATINKEKDHIATKKQEAGTRAVLAMERQQPLSPHDEPSAYAAVSSLLAEVFCRVDEGQVSAAQSQHTSTAASDPAGGVFYCDEIAALTNDEISAGLGDGDCADRAPGCPSSSAFRETLSLTLPRAPISTSLREPLGEQKYTSLQPTPYSDAPCCHARLWLWRIRRPPIPLCAICGTPFETSASGRKSSLEVIVSAGSALKARSVELAPAPLQAESIQPVPFIEAEDCTTAQGGEGMLVASVEPASADTRGALTAPEARGVRALAGTTAVVTDADAYNEGSESDVQDHRSAVGLNFLVDGPRHNDRKPLSEQRRLLVLPSGSRPRERRLPRQSIPLALVTTLCRPTRTQEAEAGSERRAATKFLLREEYEGKVSKVVKGKEGDVEEKTLTNHLCLCKPPSLGRDAGSSSPRLGTIRAKKTRPYAARSSSSSASSSSSSSSPSSSSSMLCPFSSAPPGASARSTSPAAAASVLPGFSGICFRAEWRPAGIRRDRCRSSVSSATALSSVETEALTRAGSHVCASSTCDSRTTSRCSGRKYFRCCCALALGCTWGWAFQRHPAATWRDYLGELKCGVAVALSQLPATMTCAIVANVPVTSALHGAWITGLITAIFGGSPLSVTTVTSSLAVTLAKVTRTVCDENTNTCIDEGLEFIFPALILSGACLLLLGALRLSRLSQFVPSATIVGYLNAVAILNVKAQVVTLKFDPVTSTGYEWLWVLLMISTVFIIMCVWEKIPKIRINALVPASVLGLAVSSFIEFVLVRRVCGMQTKTVAALSSVGNKDEAEDTSSKVPADASSLWPKPFFLSPANVQPFNYYFRLQDLLTTLELTLALMMVNYMSTLITVDMLTDKSSHLHVDSNPDQHLMSVGFANAMACFLGALPGSTAPSPSLLNLKLESKGREGAVIGALINLAFVAASPYFLDLVPLGGLAGIIMYTAYHAFQWRTVAAVFASFLPERLRMRHPMLQRKICRSDAFVIILTTSIALSADIGTAILSGVCIASCVFAWKNAARLKVVSRVDEEAGVKFYRVKGPIFFLTKRTLLRHFDVEKDPMSVILELSDEAEQLFDYGALETLDALVTRYRRANKCLKVVGMQCGDRKMIVKAGRLFEFAEIELVEKPLDDSGNVKTIAEMMKLPC